MQTWRRIWEARTLDTSEGSMLAALMKADGLDTGFGSMREEPWRNFVMQTAQTLGIGTASSVYEVGCGAGAFLYELASAGCRVGGSDIAAAQIEHVRRAIPQGDWSVQEAVAIDPAARYDFVMAMGVFMYFPSLEYAFEVLRRMTEKAVHAIAILDIPDASKQADAMRFRQGSLGDEEYRSRYEGLDHLYLHKQWMKDSLESLGFSRVLVRDQSIEGYGNAAFRFNVFAWKTPQPHNNAADTSNIRG